MVAEPWSLYRSADTKVVYKIADVDLTLDRYPQTKDGPKTHHVSKRIIFERILQGGKFTSGWMVTSPCDFYQPRQQRRKARSGKPAILIHISANARADACGCPCGCGRTLAKDHCGCQKPPKNGRGCISGVWEIQSNRKQPALRMPNGVCGTLYGGEGVFCRFLPFPRWRLRVAEFSSSHLRLPRLFPNLALPRVDSPSGLASQTWPCHILGSHMVSAKPVPATCWRPQRRFLPQ